MELITGRPALLVIDMQHDFLDEGVPLEAVGGRDIIPAVAGTVAAARRAGVPVIFTQEAHRPGRVDSGREADPGMGKDYYPAQWGRAPSRALRGRNLVYS
jgi:nicotinamidase-related amidase